MKVLAVSGHDRQAAAALAVDGRIVAASSEDAFVRVPGVGYAQTGGFPESAVEACFASTGLSIDEVDEVAIVCAERARTAPDAAIPDWAHGRPVRTVDALLADAVQASLSAPAGAAVMVSSSSPCEFVAFEPHDGGLRAGRAVSGGLALPAVARAFAEVLGVAAGDPFAAIDRLSVGGEHEFPAEFDDLLAWHGDKGLDVRPDKLDGLVARLVGSKAADLADPGSLNQRVQDLRRGLAASFVCRLAEVVRLAAETLVGREDLSQVAFGGDLVSHARLRGELRLGVGGVIATAAVPELAGRALGAALARGRATDALPALALGPSYSDQDIKRVLDNCRLDYVYEPDWARLHHRVSRMLEQGKLVGWFQGPLGFGPRAMGSRSILCDPSNRYARQNMNEYLRQLPVDEPLPVVFSPSMMAGCLASAAPAPMSVADVDVEPAWHDRLNSALDWRRRVRVQALGPVQAPDLCALLEYHGARTGVPGLIETNLAGPGEPVCCGPRDAVRTVYSAAIDALVIGRFVLMKDHWLLRSHVD